MLTTQLNLLKKASVGLYKFKRKSVASGVHAAAFVSLLSGSEAFVSAR